MKLNLEIKEESNASTQRGGLVRQTVVSFKLADVLISFYVGGECNGLVILVPPKDEDKPFLSAQVCQNPDVLPEFVKKFQPQTRAGVMRDGGLDANPDVEYQKEEDVDRMVIFHLINKLIHVCRQQKADSLPGLFMATWIEPEKLGDELKRVGENFAGIEKTLRKMQSAIITD